MRMLAHAQFGGADFGERITTMKRVPPGDVVAWHCEWTVTADRVAAIGDASAAAGYTVSARQAYLRSSNDYRTPTLRTTADLQRLRWSGVRTLVSNVRAFAARADPPLQPVEIPYDGTYTARVLRRAQRSSSRSRS